MYQLRVNGVVRLADGASIEENEFNPAWRDYLAWRDAGNTPLSVVGSSLSEIKAATLLWLNTWRGERRVALGLTSVTFQELVYTGKVLECQRWLTDQGSAFGLAGEAAARGLSNEAMAVLVLDQWAVWQAGSDAIEAEYITARAAVMAAGTIEEVAAVLE